MQNISVMFLTVKRGHRETPFQKEVFPPKYRTNYVFYLIAQKIAKEEYIFLLSTKQKEHENSAIFKELTT